MPLIHRSALVLAAILAPGAVLAASIPRLPEGSAPITIDGHLDEAAWQQALVIELAYETYPGDNTAPPVATRCLLLYDELQLYVAFRASDPRPDAIRAHFSDRDLAFRDDIVGIMVDPFLDGRRAFAFMTNPLGVQMDAAVAGIGGTGGYGSLTGAPGDDYSWDAIWESAGEVTAEGFVVELGIPWTALRFPRGAAEQTWGVMAFRSWPRTQRHRLHSVPINRDDTCFLCQAERISGLERMRPGRGLEFTPTTTWSKRDERSDFPNGKLEPAGEDTDAGLSARWGLTPNLSVNLALNPDFSQVEADVAQLEINRRFALFYPEKRPFFLEGADLFGTSFRAVHTRAVADPSWGLKLTGKEGPHAIGAYLARDRVTNLIFPSNQGSTSTSLEEGNDTYVLRYRRDVGTSSQIGVLFTGRRADSYRSRLGGLDGRIALSPVDAITFQALSAATRYAPSLGRPRNSIRGRALTASYSHDARDWGWWAWRTSISPEFRADAGFMPRVDTRTWGAGMRRTFWATGDGLLDRSQFGIDVARTEDFSGQLTDRRMGVSTRFEGPFQSLLIVRASRRQSRLSGALFDQDRATLFFNIRPGGAFTSSLRLSAGDQIDVANLRQGRIRELAPGITWNLGRRFFVQLDHTLQQLEVDGAMLFRANLTNARIIYHLGLRTFVRAIIQRTAIARNASLYTFPVDSRSRQVFVQYLFSYKVNPQTVVFAGYTDSQIGDDSIDLLRANRTFFVKLGYAWLL